MDATKTQAASRPKKRSEEDTSAWVCGHDIVGTYPSVTFVEKTLGYITLIY